METHERLATNEAFLAQANLLGAYLQAAKDLPKDEKVAAYRRVLAIMHKIPAGPEPDKRVLPKPPDASTFEAGAALFEVFAAESFDSLPDVPLRRSLWKHDLLFDGTGLHTSITSPDRLVAKFSFYIQARERGKFGFSVSVTRGPNIRLLIDGVKVIDAISAGGTLQGIADLASGFHRVELYFQGTRLTVVPKGQLGQVSDGTLEVRLLAPGAFDAVLLTKEQLLLKSSAATITPK